MDKGLIILFVILGFILLCVAGAYVDAWLKRRHKERNLKLKAEIVANWKGDQASLEKFLVEQNRLESKDDDEDD